MLSAAGILAVKWLALIAGASAYLLWLNRQDTQLGRACAKTVPPGPRLLMRHIQSRSLQASLWVVLCLVLLAVMDIRQHQRSGTVAKTSVAQTPPVPVAPPSIPVSTLDAALTGAQGNEATEERLDAIKESFEGGFISYAYLRRCGVAKPEDIVRIRSALVRALHTVGATDLLASSMADSIELAARGSYTELYAGSPCTAKTISGMHGTYLRYLDALSADQGAGGRTAPGADAR